MFPDVWRTRLSLQGYERIFAPDPWLGSCIWCSNTGREIRLRRKSDFVPRNLDILAWRKGNNTPPLSLCGLGRHRWRYEEHQIRFQSFHTEYSKLLDCHKDESSGGTCQRDRVHPDSRTAWMHAHHLGQDVLCLIVASKSWRTDRMAPTIVRCPAIPDVSDTSAIRYSSHGSFST